LLARSRSLNIAPIQRVFDEARPPQRIGGHLPHGNRRFRENAHLVPHRIDGAAFGQRHRQAAGIAFLYGPVGDDENLTAVRLVQGQYFIEHFLESDLLNRNDPVDVDVERPRGRGLVRKHPVVGQSLRPTRRIDQRMHDMPRSPLLYE
jgi:hypothetical protein